MVYGLQIKQNTKLGETFSVNIRIIANTLPIAIVANNAPFTILFFISGKYLSETNIALLKLKIQRIPTLFNEIVACSANNDIQFQIINKPLNIDAAVLTFSIYHLLYCRL